MSGSSGCRLEFGDSFEPSLLAFEKANYGRKDTKGRDEARAMVESVVARLLEWPAVAGSHPEPYPPGSGEAAAKQGWLLFKIEFHTPRLTGDAGCGRLIYLVHKQDQIVVPLVVYTHKQYPGRVPNQSLEEMIDAAEKQRQMRDETQQVQSPTEEPDKT